MKRILIVNNNLHVGGVQKALLNLLQEVSTEYEITLLLFFDGGEWRAKVPQNVKVISPTSPFRYWGMAKNDATHFKSRAARTFWAMLTRLLGRKWALRILYPLQRRISGYDIAISFLHSGHPKVFYGGCNEFVLRCVDAPIKITFLHCDFEKIHAVSPYNIEIYQQFDQIAACSEGCRGAFLKVMPQLSDKTVIVQNCQNYEEIRRMAEEAPVFLEKDKMNIVTVSRFGKEKGILRAIQAVAGLGDGRDAIRFYIIGSGVEFEKAKSAVSNLGLSRTVFLLGEKENPYGYMQAADVLLIPSISEAAPMVIGEAAGLGTPILTTETSSAREMVAETGYGWVCDNSVDGIRDGIAALLSNSDRLQSKKAFIRTAEFDNRNARRQFSELVL